MDVGGPRIDSTCFFDIPSVTSSTFAFVRRFAELHPVRANASNVMMERTRKKKRAAVFGDWFIAKLGLPAEVRVFPIDLIILESNHGEFLAVLVAIRGLFVNEQVLCFHRGRRAQNLFHLGLAHAEDDLVVIRGRETRAGEDIAIATG